MKPIHDRCIVDVDPVPERSDGGIFLIPKDPMNIDEQRLHTGVISAIGPEVTGVEVGERVTFTNWEDMHTDDRHMMVIHEADILGVLENG